jgi:hypothetical protein
MPSPISECEKRLDDRKRSAIYEADCASFATNNRTSPLSRSFSFVNFRPRLSISRSFTQRQFFLVKVQPFDLLWLGFP